MRILIAILLCLVSTLALADVPTTQPMTLSREGRYQRSALSLSPLWSHSQYLGSASVEEPIKKASFTTNGAIPGPAVFPWGSQLNVRTEGGYGLCCLSMTSSIAFAGTIASENATKITASIGGGTGGEGACFSMSDALVTGESVNVTVLQSPLAVAPGYLTSFCPSGTSAPGGGTVYPGCSVDADCSADSLGASGTCTAGSGAGSGAFMLCESSAAAYVKLTMTR